MLRFCLPSKKSVYSFYFLVYLETVQIRIEGSSE